MPHANFIIAGDRAAPIANDLTDVRYHAATYYLPADGQSPIRSNDATDIVFYVEEGTLEFMIGGPAGFVGAGGFIRVPAGVPYAYRNAGNETACILMRAERPAPIRKGLMVKLEFAA